MAQRDQFQAYPQQGIAPPVVGTPYQVSEEAPISWGTFNINTEAITLYYNQLANMIKSGVDVYSTWKTVEHERIKWEWENQKRDEKDTIGNVAALLEQNNLGFLGNLAVDTFKWVLGGTSDE